MDPLEAMSLRIRDRMSVGGSREPKRRLLLILPGPLWEVKDSLRKRLERLSESFEGVVMTSMPEAGRTRIGAFTLDALRFRRDRKGWMNAKFVLYGLWLALKARFARSGGERWDLVVTYDPLRAGLIGLLFARLSGARFCPEVNGCHDSYANYIDDPPGPALELKKRLYPALVRSVLARAAGIKLLFPSQLEGYPGLAGLLKRRGAVLEHFFDYVDLEPFRDLGEEKVILFVGFPFYLKGVDLLIEAFKRVSPGHPGWTLKILGWFPDKRAMNAAIGGHPCIVHHPPVYSHEMPEHMGRCGIFVLPSRTEAMGRVLLEAMASGKPRLGSDIEGIPTVIADGRDGLLFRAGDVDDLTAKLDRLMGDEGLRRALGSAGRERALREFTAEVYFSRLLKFYRRVLEQPSPAPARVPPRAAGAASANLGRTPGTLIRPHGGRP